MQTANKLLWLKCVYVSRGTNLVLTDLFACTFHTLRVINLLYFLYFPLFPCLPSSLRCCGRYYFEETCERKREKQTEKSYRGSQRGLSGLSLPPGCAPLASVGALCPELSL